MKLIFNPRLVTDIIGKGNYTEFRSILSEYVANAWDAEANEVRVSVPEDFETGSIVIKDNGVGITDLDGFAVVGANIQLKMPVTHDYLRKVMGRKGIGRFAGFACANRIEYFSKNTKHSVGVVFERGHLLSQPSISELEIPLDISKGGTPTGTEVRLSSIDGMYRIPTTDQIIRDLLLDFGLVSDFKIYVNEQECLPAKIPGEVFAIDEDNPVFGHVIGAIVVTRSPSNKQQAGLIIRVKHRRVEGPSFFGVEDSFSGKILNRIYGDISVDGLEDIISSGREAFIQHDDRYHAFQEWIKSRVMEVAGKISKEVEIRAEDIIFNLPSFQRRIARLPLHLQQVCKEYVRKMGPRLNRLRNDRGILEVFGLLIIRASENADFYAILAKLEETENIDISTLAKVLERWGFGEISYAANLAQGRMVLLERFSKIIDNDSTLELQELHRILETSTWLLDDRYTLFSSNEGLRKIVERLGKKYDGKNARKRPDLILKRDKEELVLVELKAPDVLVTMVEVEQALEYKEEILKYLSDIRAMDVYIVGRRFNEVVKQQYFERNPQRVHVLTLNSILQGAQDRLKWLSNSLKEEYDLMQSEYGEVEILPASAGNGVDRKAAGESN